MELVCTRIMAVSKRFVDECVRLVSFYHTSFEISTRIRDISLKKKCHPRGLWSRRFVDSRHLRSLRNDLHAKDKYHRWQLLYAYEVSVFALSLSE